MNRKPQELFPPDPDLHQNAVTELSKGKSICSSLPLSPTEDELEIGWPPQLLDIEHIRSDDRRKKSRVEGASSSAPTAGILLSTVGSRGSDSAVIRFDLDPKDLDTTEINDVYKEAKLKGAAEFVRDMQVICRYHVRKLVKLGVLHPCSIIREDFHSLRPPTNVIASLRDVVEFLRNSLLIMKDTVDRPTSGVLRCSWKGARPQSNSVLYGPFPETKPQTMLSRIGAFYSRMQTGPIPGYIHLADYCLSEGNRFVVSEPMFNDSTGVVAVREHMRSLDWYQRVHYKVVNAYARRCTYCWQLTGNKWRTTFDVVIKQGETELNRKGMVDHWLSWILRCQIDIYKAQLVTIPLLMENHYCLFVIDFNEGLLKLVDTVKRRDNFGWRKFAKEIVKCFFDLLEYMTDLRRFELNHFGLVVFNPPWSTHLPDPDSGLSAMQLMTKFGEPGKDMDEMGMNQELDRLERRMAICCSLVLTGINLHGPELVERARGFMWEKATNRIQPSASLLEWLGRYNRP